MNDFGEGCGCAVMMVGAAMAFAVAKWAYLGFPLFWSAK